MRILLISLLALASFTASANEPKREPPSAADILANQEVIRAEADARKGAFKDMSARKRNDLLKESMKVTTLLTGRQWAELPDAEQIEVFNSLESINATITAAEDERLVCEQKKRPGSNLTYKSCKTVAELRRQREDTVDGLDRLGRCRGLCGDEPPSITTGNRINLPGLGQSR